MGYRVEYTQDGMRKNQLQERRKAGKWSAVVLVVALVLGAMEIRQTWLPFVRDYLIPADMAVTAAAWERFAQDLKEGEPFMDALEAFCNEIMEPDPTIS